MPQLLADPRSVLEARKKLEVVKLAQLMYSDHESLQTSLDRRLCVFNASQAMSAIVTGMCYGLLIDNCYQVLASPLSLSN